MNRKINLLKEKVISSFKKNLLLGSLVLGLLFINIFMTIQTVSSGSKLSSLENLEKEIAEKNKEITYQLVNSSSLNVLRNNSQELGYKKVSNHVYIRETDSVASKLQ